MVIAGWPDKSTRRPAAGLLQDLILTAYDLASIVQGRQMGARIDWVVDINAALNETLVLRGRVQDWLIEQKNHPQLNSFTAFLGDRQAHAAARR